MGGEEPDRISVTASLTSTMTDSTSVASVDSTHVPYHILDQSGDSSSSVGGQSIGPTYDKASLTNKSEQEVLLESEFATLK